MSESRYEFLDGLKKDLEVAKRKAAVKRDVLFEVHEEMDVAKEALLNAIAKRKPGSVEIDIPDDVNVEKLLVDAGHYKLGTGPHHITNVNTSGFRRSNVPDSVLIKIQNVRDYYMEHWREHKWNEVASFTCVKLPFSKILFSYDHEFVHPEKRTITVRHVNVGVAICSVENFLSKAMEDKVDLGETIHELHTLGPESVIEARIAIDGISLPGQWYVFIDKMGQVLTDEERHLGWIWTRDPKDTAKLMEKEQWAEEFESAVGRHGCIALTALQFMNCKNVQVLDNAPTRQQRRQAEREGKQPGVTYKTLVIHPTNQKRRVVQHSDGSAIHGVSLHIVRGHFKDYRIGEGLGRAHVKGMWWWSPQVRGTSERGKVVKDYSVEVES
jgi:hypothetical protein